MSYMHVSCGHRTPACIYAVIAELGRGVLFMLTNFLRIQQPLYKLLRDYWYVVISALCTGPGILFHAFNFLLTGQALNK